MPLGGLEPPGVTPTPASPLIPPKFIAKSEPAHEAESADEAANKNPDVARATGEAEAAGHAKSKVVDRSDDRGEQINNQEKTTDEAIIDGGSHEGKAADC